MRTGILIGIALMLCLAAVPYGTELANVYVRPLDGRDSIYKDIGVPPKEWSDRYGGLSERTLIMGNLQVIPRMMAAQRQYEERIKRLEGQIAVLNKLILPNEAGDPNE